ncbi:MAG: hypothetical protein ABIN79_12450 [Marmoricola sp.]
MSPLQKIAMGMVIVIGNALYPPNPTPSWEQYDALADPLGWLLVIAGTVALARANPALSSARWWAGLAGAISVPAWFPQLNHLLDASGEWFVSLPQIVFCLLLARDIGLGGASRPPPDGPDTYVARRFGLLVWGFALVAVLPVVTIGGGVSALAGTTLMVSTLVSVTFVYLLFRVHRREWLGGPGPFEIDLRKHESRPPS